MPRCACSTRLDREIAVGGGFPVHALAGGQARAARKHLDTFGHDEGRVEAHAELADELRILLLVAREFLEELGGAGARDGAEMRNDLLAAHADAVVADGERSLVGLSASIQTASSVSPAISVGLDEGFEAQLVVGVGGVGDQLTQEDLPVAVQRMDHELHQLTDLGLET